MLSSVRQLGGRYDQTPAKGDQTRLTPDGARHLRRQASTSFQRTQGSTDGPNGPASVARDGASPICFVNGRRYTYVFRQRSDVTRRREWRRSTAQLPTLFRRFKTRTGTLRRHVINPTCNLSGVASGQRLRVPQVEELFSNYLPIE